MADNSTFWGSLVCLRPHKPAEGKIVRWTALLALLAMAVFGGYQLYQGLSRLTTTVYVCDTHLDVRGTAPGNCPKGDHALKPYYTPSWFSEELYRGQLLTIRIYLVNALWVAAGAVLAAWWLIYRTLHWAKVAEFLADTEGELRKVSWPGRKEFLNASLVVLILSACISAFLYGVDRMLSAVLSHFRIGI
jgi:preprotein translocase SecE subunit